MRRSVNANHGKILRDIRIFKRNIRDNKKFILKYHERQNKIIESYLNKDIDIFTTLNFFQKNLKAILKNIELIEDKRIKINDLEFEYSDYEMRFKDGSS